MSETKVIFVSVFLLLLLGAALFLSVIEPRETITVPASTNTIWPSVGNRK